MGRRLHPASNHFRATPRFSAFSEASGATVIPARPARKRLFDADRIGVVASVLCAIHCAVTPFFLILMPAFGKVWSHPASHWGMALVVVPVAVAMMTAGYRRHRRRWIVAIGTFGVASVLAGAALPYLENVENASAESPSSDGSSSSEEVFVYNVGEETPGDFSSTEEVFVHVAGEDLPEAVCLDSCCPSLVPDENGKLRLHIPAASIVTTLGGIALIATHLGNLCACSGCRRGRTRPRGA